MSSFLDVQTGRRSQVQRGERWAEATATAILGLHRFCKIVTLYDAGNEAAAATVDQCLEALLDLGTQLGGRVAFTFVQETIFVGGHPLKAPRKTYDVAMELATMLRHCGASELTFETELRREDLIAFAVPLRAGLRSREGSGTLIAAQTPNIEVREVHALLEARSADDAGRPTRDRVVDFYASALVVLRHYLSAVSRGANPPPTGVKRLAQRLVTLSETGDSMLVGMSAMAHAHRDDAGRSLQSAILAVALARRITDEKLALSRIALGAMLADAGRAVLVGEAGLGKLVQLAPNVAPFVPMATASVCIAAGGVNRGAATRAVTTYEATWLEHHETLGDLYAGRMPPLVQSTLLRMVRALLDRMAPRSTKAAMAPVEALQNLMREPWLDDLMRKLLISVLGFVPAGTLVELSDRSWAVVVGPSSNRAATNRPVVRVIGGPGGSAIVQPYEVDLGDESANYQKLAIARVVEEDHG